MANQNWSALANGQDVSFNPLVDTLTFDDAAISAAAVFLDLSVAGETTFSHGGKSITLLASPATLEAANFTFAGGGQLLIGDNTTATANDSAANNLTGTAEDDQLAGLGGVDTLTGGGGNDTYVVRPTASAGASGIVFIQDGVTEGPGAGSDTVYSSSSYALPDNVENLVLTGAPMWRAYTGTGNSLDNVITGEGDARQRLFGEGGADTLGGGEGNDVLDGGAGSDSLVGGNGNDVLLYDAQDTSINGGAGTDTLTLAAGGVILNLAGLAGTVIQGVEVIDLTGTGNNTLTLAAADVLAISGSTDTLRVDGGAGDAVAAGPGWTQIGNATIGAEGYAQYTNGAAALQVDLQMDRSGVGIEAMSLAVLDGANGFRLDGIGMYDFSGRSVAGAGDVNGDGFDDLIIGADGGDLGSAYQAGESYVVFGAASGFASAIELSSLNGTNGFRLDGITGNDQSGRSVASAGDVNGDGIADLIIGARYGEPLAVASTNNAGEAYVVFGRATGFASSVSLSALDGINGFRMNGIAAGDLTGASVSGAGDVNGDGYDDVIVGAYSADTGGSNAGASYVVFGRASGFASSFNLSALAGTDGFRLDGVDANDTSGESVASAGDVNGDGFDDIIIGSDRADAQAGECYVVFGKSSGFASAIDLATLNGANGFRIDGIAGSDYSCVPVASAGDVNGDGVGDLFISRKFAGAGESYVVFGQSSGFASALNLSAIGGSNGFRIAGIDAFDQSGHSLSSAGDVNGDGFDDLIIGTFNAGTDLAGESYVVFGKASGFGSVLNLSALDGTNGFRLDGAAAGDKAGIVVSAAGDVNGDGFADLIVGTSYADRGAPNTREGESYVMFGRDFNGVVDFQGTAGADALTGNIAAEAFVAGQGDDTMTGGGGADVFRGGEGDDRIVVSDTGFFDVDGGTGQDTLALDGGGITLDLTLLADSKLTGVEIVDLTGGGNNTLALTTLDLLNLSDSTNTLRVDGDSGDAVNSTGQGWVAGGTVEVFPTVFYQSYTDGAATLLLAPDLVAASTIN